MSLTLHHAVMSTYSQKAVLAFYEKGIEFTPAIVELFDPESREAYKKLYPLCKIPLLTGDDDLFIPESTIIIEYLENEYPNAGAKLIPDDKTAARRVRFKDRMADLYVNDKIAALFFDSLKPAEQRNAEMAAAAHATLDTLFAYIEESLTDQPFVAGQSITMADLALFAPLFYAQRMHPFTAHKNLSAYFQRFMQRASVQRLMKDLMPALERFNTH